MLIDQLSQQLIRHEGIALKPYRDTVGKLSLGIGRNLDDVGISKDEALYLLKNDIEKVLSQARKLPFWDDLSDNRKLVILDMVFNMGWNSFLTFKNTIKMISDKNYKGAAKNMLASKWASQVNGRAVTLANMMEQG